MKNELVFGPGTTFHHIFLSKNLPYKSNNDGLDVAIC